MITMTTRKRYEVKQILISCCIVCILVFALSFQFHGSNQLKSLELHGTNQLKNVLITPEYLLSAPLEFANPSRLPEWLYAYTEYHKNITKLEPDLRPKSTLYLKYVCRGGCGGVGDRLNGIIQGFYMALCTNRIFLIDWETPDPLNRFLAPHFVSWRQTIPSGPVLNIHSMDDNQVPSLTNPNAVPEGQSVELISNIWVGEEEILKSTCMRDYLEQFDQDPSSTHELYRKAFWTLFQWTPGVIQRVQAIRQNIQLFPNDSDRQSYVAVHVRTGLVKDTKDFIRSSAKASTWPQYYQCARDLQRGIQSKCSMKNVSDIPIYLAADTAQVKQNFLEWDEDASVKTVVDMEVFHVDRTNKAFLNDSDTAAFDIWADLKLLIDSTCLVMTVSKFSRLADWLPIQPRCAVQYDDCGSEQVERALAAVKC